MNVLVKAYLLPNKGEKSMPNGQLKLSKSEWRQVSDIAARIDWARYSAAARYAEIETGLDDCTASALRQLLRVM